MTDFEWVEQILDILDDVMYKVDELFEDSENPEHCKRLKRSKEALLRAYNTLTPICREVF